ATHLVLLHKGEVLLNGPLGQLLGAVAPALRIAARPIEKARALLAAHASVARVDELRVDGVELLRVELKSATASGDGSATIAAAALNAALHTAGIAVSHLAPERPTLEELFRRTLVRAGSPAERAA